MCPQLAPSRQFAGRESRALTSMSVILVLCSPPMQLKQVLALPLLEHEPDQTRELHSPRQNARQAVGDFETITL
jgi:hypothetical protein